MGVLAIMIEDHAFELWVSRHNHTMSFIRTITSLTAALMSSIVAFKIFGVF